MSDPEDVAIRILLFALVGGMVSMLAAALLLLAKFTVVQLFLTPWS